MMQNTNFQIVNRYLIGRRVFHYGAYNLTLVVAPSEDKLYFAFATNNTGCMNKKLNCHIASGRLFKYVTEGKGAEEFVGEIEIKSDWCKTFKRYAYNILNETFPQDSYDMVEDDDFGSFLNFVHKRIGEAIDFYTQKTQGV